MCHILFLLPFIALALFFFLPAAQATFLSIPLFLIFLWLAWVTWKDMRRPVPTGIEGLMGDKAQVVKRSKDGAKVLLRGELWDAPQEEGLSGRVNFLALSDPGGIDALYGGVLARESSGRFRYDGVLVDKHCFGSFRFMADPETAPTSGCLIGLLEGME